MTQSQQLRKLAARSATAFLLAALCVFPLYIDKFSNLGVVKFTGICTLRWARSQRRAWCPPCSPSRRGPRSGGLAATTAAV